MLTNDDQSELHCALLRLTGAIHRVTEALDYNLDGRTDDCRLKVGSAKVQTERALKILAELSEKLDGVPA